MGGGFRPLDPGLSDTADYLLSLNSSDIFGVSSGVDYSLSQCILLTPGGLCQDTAPLGSSYTSIATVSFDPASLPQPIPDKGLLFFLSGLSGAPAYSTDAVSIVLDPAPIPGFVFTPLETIVWSPPAADQSFYYLGFRLFPGQLEATLRYDVSAQLAGGTPALETNASYVFVVPEPATALLVGLGTLGLSMVRRRRRAE